MHTKDSEYHGDNTINASDRDYDESKFKIREYINPAVYIETTYDMSNNPSATYMNIPGSGDHPKVLKVKRCVCFTNPNNCPCHPKILPEPKDIEPDTPIKNGFYPVKCDSTTSLIQKTDFESDSGITVKQTVSSPEDLRLSIGSSLTSLDALRIPDIQAAKEENFKNWCARKDEERRSQQQKEELARKVEAKKRELRLEEERANFKRWLVVKKLEEERRRMEDEQNRAEAERKKRELQERRDAEKEINFQLWLKKKEELMLEKKIKEQVMFIKKEEERQRRQEFSQRSYEIWLQQSKSKPKPLPTSRGLDSLNASASVTYINPLPWVPNIDKPASQ